MSRSVARKPAAPCPGGLSVDRETAPEREIPLIDPAYGPAVPSDLAAPAVKYAATVEACLLTVRALIEARLNPSARLRAV
ncbi:hypothetical protein DND90_31445 [Pseudomonas syringae pv. maculicola]|nr:hypothetical protein DND90_31445 [Pseudomonas syringae pv. maculicola]